jgi:polysaccharide biosynthesis transport protein
VDLRDFFEVMRRRWIVVVAITVAVLAVVLAYSFLQKPVYEAEATCMVSATLRGEQEYTALQVIDQLMQTINKIAVSRPILEQASKKLPNGAGATTLTADVSSTVVNNTQLLQIKARSQNKRTAMLEANAVSDALVAHFSQPDNNNSSYKVVQIEPALVPTTPVSPKPVRNGILGGLLGLVLGVICAVIIESVNREMPIPFQGTADPQAHVEDWS